MAVALGLAGSGCGTSANGEQGKSATQAWADAMAATTGAKDLHVAGSITNRGQTLTLDLNMSRSGDGGGTIGLSGHVLHLVVNSGLVYIRADNSAWHYVSGGNTMSKYAGRWVMTPMSSGSPISNYADFANSSKFLANLKPKGRLSKRPGTLRWEGHTAVVISDSTRAELYVSDTGKPYLLHLTGGTDVSHGSMDFEDYGSAPAPKVPKGAVSFTS